MKVYFSDHFNVDVNTIEEYGAFNPSLINDLPLFIDPFLLYTNDDEELRNLHHDVIAYVAFLREKSAEGEITSKRLKDWFTFPEVKQNWFGYSENGCGGRGLGQDFADSLNNNLNTIFTNFGSENITKESHLEKLCLIKEGTGKDSISDFTTNLIKQYLLEYTQRFSEKYIDKKYLSAHMVKKVYFDYNSMSWKPAEYILPTYNNDYVLLTPKSILTKDRSWINKNDLISNFDGIVDAISNVDLREKINHYFSSCLPEEPKKRDYIHAIKNTISMYPEYIDYFIKAKEDTYKEARNSSNLKVSNTEEMFISNLNGIYEKLSNTEFYDMSNDTFDELYIKAMLLKSIIEDGDGHSLLRINSSPITRESELRILIKFIFLAKNPSTSIGKVNQELCFKLASNNVLKDSIDKKLKLEKALPENEKSIFAIICYTDRDFSKVLGIFKDFNISESKTLFIIDARESA